MKRQYIYATHCSHSRSIPSHLIFFLPFLFLQIDELHPVWIIARWGIRIFFLFFIKLVECVVIYSWAIHTRIGSYYTAHIWTRLYVWVAVLFFVFINRILLATMCINAVYNIWRVREGMKEEDETLERLSLDTYIHQS